MTKNRSGPQRPPTNPITPADSDDQRKRQLEEKIATNAAAAIATITPFFSTRLPIRSTASTTTASTAGFRPKKIAVDERHVADTARTGC